MEWNGEFVKYTSLMAHYFSFGGGGGREGVGVRKWSPRSMVCLKYEVQNSLCKMILFQRLKVNNHRNLMLGIMA